MSSVFIVVNMENFDISAYRFLRTISKELGLVESTLRASLGKAVKENRTYFLVGKYRIEKIELR